MNKKQLSLSNKSLLDSVIKTKSEIFEKIINDNYFKFNDNKDDDMRNYDVLDIITQNNFSISMDIDDLFKELSRKSFIEVEYNDSKGKTITVSKKGGHILVYDVIKQLVKKDKHGRDTDHTYLELIYQCGNSGTFFSISWGS